jgi:hypothetical protein
MIISSSNKMSRVNTVITWLLLAAMITSPVGTGGKTGTAAAGSTPTGVEPWTVSCTWSDSAIADATVSTTDAGNSQPSPPAHINHCQQKMLVCPNLCPLCSVLSLSVSTDAPVCKYRRNCRRVWEPERGSNPRFLWIYHQRHTGQHILTPTFCYRSASYVRPCTLRIKTTTNAVKPKSTPPDL